MGTGPEAGPRDWAKKKGAKREGGDQRHQYQKTRRDKSEGSKATLDLASLDGPAARKKKRKEKVKKPWD